MTLIETIQSDLKEAMKAKEEKITSALRMLIAAIKNEEINKRPAVLEEAEIFGVIKKEIKKLNDAIEQFKQGGREDLAGSYGEEASILKKYLPAELGEDEIRKIVKAKVAEASDKNFGVVMKAVMQELKGKAEGGIISRILKEELGN